MNDMTETNATIISKNAVEAQIATRMDGFLKVAIEKGAEQMTALYTIFDKERADARRGQFHQAFAAAQGEFPNIPKNRQAKMNGQVRYEYADLAKVFELTRPVLAKHGLGIRVCVVPKDGVARCDVFGYGHVESNEFTLASNILHKGSGNAAQDLGAAATYAKRYAVYDALGIFPSNEDTDANTDAAQTPAKPPAQTPKKDFGNGTPRPAQPPHPAEQRDGEEVGYDKKPSQINIIKRVIIDTVVEDAQMAGEDGFEPSDENVKEIMLNAARTMVDKGEKVKMDDYLRTPMDVYKDHAKKFMDDWLAAKIGKTEITY